MPVAHQLLGSLFQAVLHSHICYTRLCPPCPLSLESQLEVMESSLAAADPDTLQLLSTSIAHWMGEPGGATAAAAAAAPGPAGAHANGVSNGPSCCNGTGAPMAAAPEAAAAAAGPSPDQQPPPDQQPGAPGEQ
jgi:hypothetical protein